MYKKILLVALAFLAVVIAFNPSQVQAEAGYLLVAGQNVIVGQVVVSNDVDNLFVTFNANIQSGFCLKETHLHVAETWQEIPQTKTGNPKVGHFAFKGVHECEEIVEYGMPLGDWEPGSVIAIAAHAVIGHSMDDNDIGWQESAWAAVDGNIENNQFPGANWAVYVPYLVEDVIPEDLEHEALVTIYHSMDGDNWNYYYSNWLDEGIHHCQWFGVTCDADKYVTELYFYDNNMTGSLPPEISNLANLTALYIEGAHFTSPLPPELGSLEKLEWLFVTYNDLTGSIPPEIGNLNNLKVLSFEGNQLTGQIPPELSNLTNLWALYLYFNQLSGPIPPEFGNMTNSVALFLSHNQLTGSIPPELGNSNIVGLLLGHNQLTGSIPPELGDMPLQYLELSSNQLTGPIPPELGNLANTLYYLHLDNNQLTGSLPQELGNLTNLWELYLDNNQLSGCIPWELSNLSMLESLWLQNNAFSGWESQASLDWALSLLDYEGPDFVADSCQ